MQRSGRIFTWLSGGALAMNLLMIGGLIALLFWMGAGYFWQKPVVELTLSDKIKVIGEPITRRPIRSLDRTAESPATEIKLKTGNRDLADLDYRWIPEAQIESSATPDDLVLLERLEYGNFYGRFLGLRKNGKPLAHSGTTAWHQLQARIESKAELRAKIRKLERGPLGDVNHALAKLQRKGVTQGSQELLERAKGVADQLRNLRAELVDVRAEFETASGTHMVLAVGKIMRAVHPNRLSSWDKMKLYGARVWEFVWDDPRESNTEGGIFPAIFGTILMVFLMTFAVTPLGVLAALYLREYAKDGFVVRLVRIAVNNLAGVPSIVFGVFGLGFFVYLCGGTIDSLFYSDALPTPTFGTGGILWGALTLALLTVPVVIVATEEGLAAVPRIARDGSLALGATKFETTWKVVLPAAGPGILTGVILAIARAAGEVAPLMIVGMVKLAPELPVDHRFPFFHLERKFMHLGFHIYDVGFQSPNVEATKPLVYATALLLVILVTAVNLVAIAVRNRLRRKYATSAV